MNLTRLAIRNYRSLHDIELPVSNPCVIVGGNGVGKTSLYRTLQLLSAAAAGQFGRRVAEEGGMDSMLWAGEKTYKDKGPVRLTIEAQFDDWTYSLAAGVPQPVSEGGFLLDPRVKEETLGLRVPKRKTPIPFLSRTRPSALVRDPDGRMETYAFNLLPSESILSQLADPARFPELARLKETIEGWRFYDHFDISPTSPLRHQQVGTMTPVLASDGADLPAALASVEEIDHDHQFADINAMIAEGLDGCRLYLVQDRGRFSFELEQPGLLRPLKARELSGGTLRYIALAAALHPLADPTLTVFNEPEASLNESLLPALGQAIALASERRPIWVITHSTVLADCIASHSGVAAVTLAKRQGETVVL